MTLVYDPDYDMPAGRPRIRRIWHPNRHCYVEVAATDIGRAPAPEHCAVVDEQLIPEAGARSNRQCLQPDPAVDAYLAEHGGSALVQDVAEATERKVAALASWLQNRRTYYTVTRQYVERSRGRGGIRLVVSLRERELCTE